MIGSYWGNENRKLALTRKAYETREEKLNVPPELGGKLETNPLTRKENKIYITCKQ